MSRWQSRRIPFKFQLSDWTFFSFSLTFQVRQEKLIDQTPPVEIPIPPIGELTENNQGFLIRGLPTLAVLPTILRIGDYLCYASLQYQHCYINLGMPFEDYQKQFSSKTRSTINRKIKKYEKHCGGTITWKTYAGQAEMRDFFKLARKVSILTYQERLLDSGIPNTEEFIQHAEALASNQCVRAYILFEKDRPVSYLYSPIQDNVLTYAYLGYDPEYMHLSVGTILQWLAIEQLFKEARFRYFDFTEGQSDHKRLFATNQRQCANVFFLKKNIRNITLIYSHMLMNRFSKWLGEVLEKFGIKAKIKRLLRFG